MSLPCSDPSSNEDFDFYAFNFKVDPCPLRVPHDWAQCSFAHRQGGERSARRDLKRHPYLSIPCEYAKKREQCPKGDDCPHAHSLYEYWLHPARFRTEVCQYGLGCKRPVCFFAHTSEQLRPADPSLPPAELCWQTGASLHFGRNKAAAAAAATAAAATAAAAVAATAVAADASGSATSLPDGGGGNSLPAKWLPRVAGSRTSSSTSSGTSSTGMMSSTNDGASPQAGGPAHSAAAAADAAAAATAAAAVAAAPLPRPAQHGAQSPHPFHGTGARPANAAAAAATATTCAAASGSAPVSSPKAQPPRRSGAGGGPRHQVPRALSGGRGAFDNSAMLRSPASPPSAAGQRAPVMLPHAAHAADAAAAPSSSGAMEQGATAAPMGLHAGPMQHMQQGVLLVQPGGLVPLMAGDPSSAAMFALQHHQAASAAAAATGAWVLGPCQGAGFGAYGAASYGFGAGSFAAGAGTPRTGAAASCAMDGGGCSAAAAAAAAAAGAPPLVYMLLPTGAAQYPSAAAPQYFAQPQLGP